MNQRSSHPITRRALVAVALCLAWGSNAEAQDDVPCASLPNPIYGQGGSAPNPLIASFATALASSPNPITVIYASPGACFIMRSFQDGTPLTGTAFYWTAAGEQRSCTLPLDGVPIQYGSMAQTAALCEGFDANPPNVYDVPGPVTSWVLMAPLASSQRVISSEAIYTVYGFGRESGTAPWTDETQLFSRNPTSAALLALEYASTLPANRFLGTDVVTNGNMVTRLASSSNPEAALGFASGETADARRDQVRVLAYQHRGQLRGYTPDSTPTAFDKINVREGRYWLWAFHRFFWIGGTAEAPPDPSVARFIRLITGEASEPEVDSIRLIVENGNIPLCAMKATRTGDYSPLIPYEAPEPCGCAFDAIATGTTTCAECSASSPCAEGVCRNGYCEEH